MYCTQLTENTGPKKSPKIRHLGTIAALCLCISSQLRRLVQSTSFLVRELTSPRVGASASAFSYRSECQSVVSSATLRLLGFAQNGATVHVRGCTGTTVNTVRLHLLLLLAGNDTVPVSMWRCTDMQHIERPLALVCILYVCT